MTSQKKTSHHIFKMAIFPKFFGDIIIFIIRVNADKRIKKNFYIFSIKNLEYTFVCFLSIQSLIWPVCRRALQVVPPHVFHLQFLVLDMDRFLAKTPRSWFTLPYQVHWQLITTLANASLQLSLVQLYLLICQLCRYAN